MGKKTILFADNLPEFLITRKEFLEEANYNVITADNPDDARKILEKGDVDLAILDIRLVNDEDDRDTSGLDLAKTSNRLIPKIMLTGYPSWEAVRASLGSDWNMLPPAVDFLAKAEGPEALMQSVDFFLNRPLLRTNVLAAFETTNLMSLRTRIENLSPQEAADRLRNSFDATSNELTKFREQENDRASLFHTIAIVMALIGMAVILFGVILVYNGSLSAGVLPGIAGLISESISFFFFTREEKAHRRMTSYFDKLEEVNKLGNLLKIIDTLKSENKREEIKIKIINKIIEKWLG